MTARMLGRTRPSWCPQCRRPAGLDCPDTSRSTRESRKIEQRQWRREEWM